MRPLRARFGKICQWTKKIKDAAVYGWGRQIFPESPKENKNSSNISTARFLRKLMHSIVCKAFYQCSYKNVALSCGFMCDRKTNSQKIGQYPYFKGFRTDPKKTSLIKK